MGACTFIGLTCIAEPVHSIQPTETVIDAGQLLQSAPYADFSSIGFRG